MGRRAGLSVPRKRKPSASPTASTRTPRKRPRSAAQAPQLSPVLRASRKKRHVRAEGSNTPEERMYIYADYHHWVKSGKSSGGVAAIAKKYNVHRQYPARLYSKGTPVDRRAFNPGRPYLLSDKDMEQIKKLLEEHHYDLSYREIEELVVNLDMGSPADTTIWRAMERAGYKLSSRRLRPLLTELHKAERLAFAIKHLERHWGNVIELDEKYFYAWSPRRKLKVPPGVKAPRMRMQSKRFVPKVMVLWYWQAKHKVQWQAWLLAHHEDTDREEGLEEPNSEGHPRWRRVRSGLQHGWRYLAPHAQGGCDTSHSIQDEALQESIPAG